MEPLYALLRVQAAALVGVLLAFGVYRVVGARGFMRAPRRWAGLVLLGGLLGAYFAQYGLPESPLGEDTLRAHERLFWMLMPLLGASLMPWRLSLLPVALVLPLVLVNQMGDWSLEVDELTPRLLLPLAAVCLAASGDLLFRQRSGKHGAIQLGIWSAAIAGAVGATGSASYATWAGAIGLGFGVTTLCAWRDWNAGMLDGAMVALTSGAFLLLGARYSELDPFDAALLAAALPISLLVEHFANTRRSKLLLGWVALLLPIGFAFLRIALAWEPNPYA